MSFSSQLHSFYNWSGTRWNSVYTVVAITLPASAVCYHCRVSMQHCITISIFQVPDPKVDVFATSEALGAAWQDLDACHSSFVCRAFLLIQSSCLPHDNTSAILRSSNKETRGDSKTERTLPACTLMVLISAMWSNGLMLAHLLTHRI